MVRRGIRSSLSRRASARPAAPYRAPSARLRCSDNTAAAASMQARFVIAAKPLPPLGADLKPIAENDSYALFELPPPEPASPTSR